MLDESNFKDIKGNKWDDSKTFSFKGKLKNKTLNRWKLLISDEDLYLCQSIAEKQMRKMKYKISKKKISDDKVKSAIKKLRESKLLNSVYLHWIKTGEGSPKYPLDPTKPENWDRKFVKVKNKFNI